MNRSRPKEMPYADPREGTASCNGGFAVAGFDHVPPASSLIQMPPPFTVLVSRARVAINRPPLGVQATSREDTAGRLSM